MSILSTIKGGPQPPPPSQFLNGYKAHSNTLDVVEWYTGRVCVKPICPIWQLEIKDIMDHGVPEESPANNII